MNIFKQLEAAIKAEPARSAWARGVKAYALELAETLEHLAANEGRDPENVTECRKWMLDGARDWSQYGWGGCALIYDYQIAERLCTPSELKKSHNGKRRPNSSEEWLDTQTRALHQAANMALIQLRRFFTSSE